MDGKGLDTRTRYAFSYEIAPAAAGARQVNIAAQDGTLVEAMVRGGLAHYVEGVATYEGARFTEWRDFPTRVRFHFGWGGAVSYLNCANPDNPGSDAENRGVAPRRDGPQRAVLTMHLEHLFWDQLGVENPALRFDPMAARAAPRPAMDPLVTLEDLAASQITNLTDRNGQGVKDRGQLPGYTPQMATLRYDAAGVPGITNLRQFAVYSAQAMAHLNGDGLCYVHRK
jgi:hypothetical protein